MEPKELVEMIVRGLCKDQAHIEVNQHTLSRSTTVVVRVAPQDMGKILGTRRVTLDAIRRIMKLSSLRSDRIVRVEILEPFPIQRRAETMYAPDVNWDKARFESILEATVRAVFEQPAVIDESVVTPIHSVFQVRIAEGERMLEALELLQSDFEVLFHAIGKSMAHTVHVDLVPRTKLTR